MRGIAYAAFLEMHLFLFAASAILGASLFPTERPLAPTRVAARRGHVKLGCPRPW